MAIRNIFDFLLSNEVKRINVDAGVVMVYHGNYVNKTYKAGSFVRYNNGVDYDMYIARVDTSTDPVGSSDWDKIALGVALPQMQLVDVNGLIMIDSNLDNIKVV